MPITRTNYRNLEWDRKKVYGIIGSFQDSIVASGVASGDAFFRDAYSWAGITCSLRFLHLNMHATEGGVDTSMPILEVTTTASTTAFFGFYGVYATEGSILTGIVNNTLVFDWQAVIISI